MAILHACSIPSFQVRQERGHEEDLPPKLPSILCKRGAWYQYSALWPPALDGWQSLNSERCVSKQYLALKPNRRMWSCKQYIQLSASRDILQLLRFSNLVSPDLRCGVLEARSSLPRRRGDHFPKHEL